MNFRPNPHDKSHLVFGKVLPVLSTTCLLKKYIFNKYRGLLVAISHWINLVASGWEKNCWFELLHGLFTPKKCKYMYTCTFS
jgi:hypothetical protein